MRSQAFALRIFLGSLLVVSGVARADSDSYVASIPNQHPFEFFHYQSLPELPSLLARDESSLSVVAGWSSDYNLRNEGYLVDAESRELDLQYCRGLSDRVTLVVSSAARSIDGGILDPLIKDWDRVLGFSNRSRNNAPDGRFRINGRTDEGNGFELSKAEFGVTDIQLGTRLEILRETPDVPQLTLSSDLTLPTHLGTYGQDSIDVGMSLLAAKQFSSVKLFGGLGGALFGDRKEQGVRFDPGMLDGFAGVLIPLSQEWTLQVDALCQTSAVRDVQFYPDIVSYLDIGIQYRVSQQWDASLLVRENPIRAGATTDVTGVLGARYHWL